MARIDAVAVLLAAVGDPFDLETRRRLYRLVGQYPGLHLNEIARQLGAPANLTAYHLRTLERHGLVSARKEAGYVRYFARGPGRVGLQDELAPAAKDRVAILRRRGPLHIVLCLLHEDELSIAQLSRRTKLTHATLAYHLERLEAAGLVRTERDGRERRCRLADPAGTLRLLLAYRPPDPLVEGFLDAWQALEAGLRPDTRDEP